MKMFAAGRECHNRVARPINGFPNGTAATNEALDLADV
jgi:hypothetical protein